MTILPGETPCLRCVFEAAPAPGEAGTCETAGVLGPIVNIVASFQATEAIKILTGQLRQGQPRAALLRRVGEHAAPHQDRAAAGQGRLPLLPAPPLRVAGRRARLADDEPVRPQRRAGVAPHRRRSSTSRRWPATWRRWAQVSYNRFLLKFNVGRATSSPSSPTAGPSSRAPTTSTGPGRCTPGTSGTERRSWDTQDHDFADSFASGRPAPARASVHQFSVAQYHQMIQAGILNATERVELARRLDHRPEAPQPAS